MSYNARKRSLMLTICAPWILSQLFAHHPVLSFFIAFCGSFFIFYATILSPYRCIESHRPLVHQLMRPIILLQLIFAGYMCCTSIFHFADHLGFEYWRNVRHQQFHVNERTFLLAKCQRLVLLGHIALVIGILTQLKIKYHQKFKLSIPLEIVLIYLTIGSLTIALCLNHIPALIQFKYYLLALSAAGQAYVFILGMVRKKPIMIAIGGIALTI
jgi:hypothetical protein